MARSQRLLNLIQLLRSHRFPVPGAQLAEALEINLRTLYRDIATLREQGACIDGEAGMGYVLRPGFMLPPLMFSEEEIEALVLGSRWVAQRADPRLATAAASALVKVATVLPQTLRTALEANALLVGPSAAHRPGPADLSEIRRAIRAQQKLTFDYTDLNQVASSRTIWPFALGYFDAVSVVVGWCELRQDFRHFRTDRIAALTLPTQRYPGSRQAMEKAWRAQQSIASKKDATADKN